MNKMYKNLPQGTTNRGTTGTIHPDLPVFSRGKITRKKT